jgi:hypothetical protein
MEEKVRVVNGYKKMLFEKLPFMSYCLQLLAGFGKLQTPSMSILKKNCFKVLEEWS